MAFLLVAGGVLLGVVITIIAAVVLMHAAPGFAIGSKLW